MEDDTQKLVERARVLTAQRERLTQETRRLIQQSEDLRTTLEWTPEQRLPSVVNRGGDGPLLDSLVAAEQLVV